MIYKAEKGISKDVFAAYKRETQVDIIRKAKLDLITAIIYTMTDEELNDMFSICEIDIEQSWAALKCDEMEDALMVTAELRTGKYHFIAEFHGGKKAVVKADDYQEAIDYFKSKYPQEISFEIEKI